METETRYDCGPDQLIGDELATKLTTTQPDGTVKLRQYEHDGSERYTPLSVPSMLKNAAERYSTNTAMAVKRDGKWMKWNYQEYYDQSKIAAKAFIQLGLERYHAVCILGFNCPEWFISQMGAIMAGGFSVGIYTTNSPEACKYVADNCRANVIVVEDNKQLEKILAVKNELPHVKAIIQYAGIPHVKEHSREDGDHHHKLVYSWKEFLDLGMANKDFMEKELTDRLKKIAVNQCCALIYTSGTTGQPKGAMMSHDNLTWTARISNEFLSLTEKDILLSYLPLSHSAAQMMDVWMTMAAGASLYFADKNALKGSLGDTLKEVRPTTLFGVPRVFEKIAEKMQQLGKSAPPLQRSFASWAKKTGLEHNLRKLEGGDETPAQGANKFSYPIAKKLVFSKVKEKLGFDRCRLIGCGAAPLSRETFDYFLSLDIRLLECYGMTETSGPQCGNRPGDHKAATVGRTMPGCQTKINEPDAKTGKGEICMSSRNVMMGYLFCPEKTIETIGEDGWLHSGDIGCKDASGYMKITGRIKELIITAGGENVPPLLIEDAVKAELPCISNAMVVGDRKKFLSCLLTMKVQADPDTMEPKSELTTAAADWCKEVGADVKTIDDVLGDKNSKSYAKITRAIQQGIDKANEKATSNAQKIQKWILLTTDFSVPGGELGPTLKLKRHHVLAKYSESIRNMYNV